MLLNCSLSLCCTGGFILQPGMVHGTRQLSDTVSIPLSLIGSPLETLLTTSPMRIISGNNENIDNLNVIQSSFIGRLLATPPISVDNVARAAAGAAVVGRNLHYTHDQKDGNNIRSAKFWTYDEMIEVSKMF